MKNLLPIGTVVRLKGGKKNLMIVGILQQDDFGNKYDYIACIFPEGYIDEETFFMFNQNDIEEIIFFGCINAEVQIYIEGLKQEGLFDD